MPWTICHRVERGLFNELENRTGINDDRDHAFAAAFRGGSHLTLTSTWDAHCNSGGNKIYQIYKRITEQCNSGAV